MIGVPPWRYTRRAVVLQVASPTGVLCCLLTLLLLAAGCTAQREGIRFPSLFRPGEDLTLRLRDGHTTEPSDGFERDFLFHEITMAVSAEPGSASGHVPLTILPLRWASGIAREPNWQEPDEDVLAEHPQESGDQPPAKVESSSPLEPVALRGVVRQGRRITGFTRNGVSLDRLLSKENLKDNWSGDLWLSAVCRTGLEDVLAYLPKHPVRIGDTWTVTRGPLFPLDAIAIGYLTGSAAAQEKATCSLVDVRHSPGGRVAEIHITGRRDGAALFPASGARTGNYFVCRGTLRVNLDTGRLEGFFMERSARFKEPPVPGASVTLIQSVSLQPATD